MRQYSEIVEHYTEYDEVGRLFRIRAHLERLRTQELILRHLPPAPAKVADIGGRFGCACFLAGGTGLCRLPARSDAQAHSAGAGTSRVDGDCPG